MKFYLMYQLIPFLFTQPNIKNKYGLITSIMLNKSNYKIILKNNIVIKMPRSALTTLYTLLCILRQCVYHNVTKDGTMVVSFDFINKFDFNLKNLTVEDKNLIDVLSLGHLFGANFITPEDTNTIQTTKTLNIFEKDGKKILETNNGVMYFIENLHLPSERALSRCLRGYAKMARKSMRFIFMQNPFKIFLNGSNSRFRH